MKALSFLFTIILAASCVQFAAAQRTLTGVVADEAGERLTGATVQWAGSESGAVTGIDGRFSLPRNGKERELVVSYVGYEPMTVPVAPEKDTIIISLSGSIVLTTVEVAAGQKDNYTSLLDTRNVEWINSGELKKAPCCNLGESFETNATVDVAYSDALTGAREIRMLGLSGVYTQLLLEKRPFSGGLASAYALDYLPGTWLESIQIGKGASTVQTGFQGVAGQINSEIVKPFSDKQLFVNFFGASNGRAELNLHLNRKFNDQWSSGLLLHGNLMENEVDHEGDSFLDMPKKRMVNGMYRLFYRGKNVNAQFNVHALTERRIGGQFRVQNNGQHPLFQIVQDNDRAEVFGKLGYIGFADPYKSAGIIMGGTWHQMNARYGLTRHSGKQRSFYANAFYTSIIGTSDHQFTVGAGFQFDDYDEQLNDTDNSRRESQPGIFGEYVFSRKKPVKALDEFALVAGLRIDRHNMFGMQVTPRLHMKMNFSENNILRLSAGRGFRSPNVLAENVSFLATSRQVRFIEQPALEEAWNYGANFTWNFLAAKKEGSLTVDIYRTHFVNQVIMDIEADYREVQFYNLQGTSYSNSFLISLNYELLRGLDLKLAYKFNDVRVSFRDGIREPLLVPRHRGLFTADYETRNKRWRINVNTQIVGQQRLLPPERLPHSVTHGRLISPVSPAYVLLSGQATWKADDRLEIYAGSENLTNYRQSHPVIGADDPFGEYFDATQVYAPTMGRVGYVGVRWGIQ